MELIDTHIHFDSEVFSEGREQLIQGAQKNNIFKLLIPNVDEETAEGVIEVCNKFPDFCFPMMGIHPTSVKGDFDKQIQFVEQQLKKRKFIAIGEIGIDLYWDKSMYREQEIIFTRQMEIAREVRLPVIIHSRKSLDEILTIIKRNKLEDIPGIFHCFPGSMQQANKVIDMGYKIGIGGVITFKNSGLAEIVKHIPLTEIVLETDAPWLAPSPHRGKTNLPEYLAIIAHKIAEIKEINIDTVADTTTATAKTLFKLT